MEKEFKIEIPKPCFEDWDQMTTKKNGRHCESCNEIVVDFARMTDEEVKHYFINNQSTKTCGHFYKDQVTDNNSGFKKVLKNAYTSAQHINLKLFRYASLSVLSSIIFLIGCNERTKGKIECTNSEKLIGDTNATKIDSSKVQKDSLKRSSSKEFMMREKHIKKK